MPRVLICDKLEAAGLDLLKQAGIEIDNRPGLSGSDLQQALQAADGAIVRSGTRITAELLENPGKLRAIVRAGVGVDNIDVAAATRKGIVVMNTPGGNTVSTAEHTITLLMALARHIARRRRESASRQVGTRQIRRHATRREDARRHRPGPHRPRGRAPRRRAGHEGRRLRSVPRPPIAPSNSASKRGRRSRPTAAALRFPHGPHSADGRDPGNDRRDGISNCSKRAAGCSTWLAAASSTRSAWPRRCKSGHLAGRGARCLRAGTAAGRSSAVEIAERRRSRRTWAPRRSRRRRTWPREAAQLLIDCLTRGVVQFAVNMAAVDKAELAEVRLYVDLARRLGLLAGANAPGGDSQGSC